MIRSDYSSFITIEALRKLTVPGRYLVVRLVAVSVPVYIHNVYAPVDDHEKAVVSYHLPMNRFENNATHIVLGA